METKITDIEPVELNRPWVAFFSQTGSEIAAIIRRLKIIPSVIVTNRSHLDGVNHEIIELWEKYPHILKFIPNKPDVFQYINVIPPNALITLHGYLRIVPKAVCDNYEIYNLHPGDIITYPGLKGFDPQKRAFSEKHKVAGCVLHKCEEKVDSGAIIASERTDITNCLNVEAVILALKIVALNMWCKFLEKRIMPIRQPENRSTTFCTITGECQYNPLLTTNVENFMKQRADTQQEKPSTQVMDIVEKQYPQTCKAFKQIMQEQYELFCKKQHDYGPHNISLGSTLEKPEDVKASLCGITFRLHDKIQRLINMVVKKGVIDGEVNEALNDTFVDISVYGVIAQIVKQNKWNK